MNNTLYSKKRMFSSDLNSLIKDLPINDKVPTLLNRDPSKENPDDNEKSTAYTIFEQIESLIGTYAEHPQDLDINIVETLGLPIDVIDLMTEKMHELVQMFENADNDDYPFHLSIGSINNVGMTVCRRILYLAIMDTYSDGMKSVDKYESSPSRNPYPMVDMDHDVLLPYLSKLFLRIYKYKLTKQLFPLYAAGCAVLCHYTKHVIVFNDYLVQQVFDAVFNFFEGSKIQIETDLRTWKNHVKTPRHLLSQFHVEAPSSPSNPSPSNPSTPA